MDLLTLTFWTISGLFFLLLSILTLIIIIGAPVLFPYLKVKLNNGVLLILETYTGSYRFIPLDSKLHNKKYGTFLPSQEKNAIFRIAGISAAFAFEGLAVPATQAATTAATKLKNANFLPYHTLEDTADEAQIAGIITKRDASALYYYANSVNPTSVNVRIEHRAAELMAQNRDNFSKVAAYCMLFIMVMISAALAYYIITTGTGSSAVSAVAGTASTIAM